MYNSHYVPRFILRMFGGHFDEYTAETQRFRHGLTPVQGFFIPGLYDDRVDRILDNVEGLARQSIEKLRQEGNGSLSSTEKALVRKYLVLSYLRTPYARTLFDAERWNDMLAEIATDGFDRSRYKGDGTLQCELALFRADFLSRASIWHVTATHADDFLISDKGVTFLGPDDAIYPISRSEAIWATASEEPPKLNLSDNNVFQINRTILSDFYNVLGMTAFERVFSSITSSRDISPDHRLANLHQKARDLNNCGHPEFNTLLRKNSGVYYVMIPSKFYCYLTAPADESVVMRCIDSKDYIGLSAILVFIRYGLLDLPPGLIEDFISGIPYGYLRKILDKYVGDADYEFQKFQSFIFLEVASERGDGESSDRLRRYYRDGKHTPADPEKAELYLHRGCEQGYNDCLTAYLKAIGTDPDYREKIAVYREQIDNSAATTWMVAAKVYLDNGDYDSYLKYLRRAAYDGYTGAVSKWVELLTAREPYDLSEIAKFEDMTVDRQLGASDKLAAFYYARQDLFPGKLAQYIARLERAGSIFAEPIRKKYLDS